MTPRPQRRTASPLETHIPLDPARAHTPLWLLDIDGVLNAFLPAGPSTAVYTSNPTLRPPERTFTPPSWAWSDYRTYRAPHPRFDNENLINVRVSPELITRIAALHNNNLVEIVWATTWGTNAQRFADTVGLPTFPAIEAHLRMDSLSWFKHQAAYSVAASRRPMIWTDDMEISSRFAANNENRLDFTPKQQHLLIAADERYGLLPDDITTIEAFCAQHAHPARAVRGAT